MFLSGVKGDPQAAGCGAFRIPGEGQRSKTADMKG